MNLVVVMAVWNEEPLIGAALDSLFEAGITPGQVCVFDGAWRGGPNGSHIFGGATKGMSTDDTMQIASDFGCKTVPVDGPWPSQEAKRTAMFRFAGYALQGEPGHVFVFDADERLTGRFPDILPDGHANVFIRCIGENDMPGIRGEWPMGDFSNDYKPELRLFEWNPTLECVYPGGYLDSGEFIKPYVNSQGDSALPVLSQPRVDHLGNERSDLRMEQKIAYYTVEQPERRKWQKAIHQTD